MISPTAESVISRVQALLDAEEEARRFGLYVVRDATREEDGWVYLIVEPQRPGIRAYDFVEVLGRVERRVREEQDRNVLIVPAAA